MNSLYKFLIFSVVALLTSCGDVDCNSFPESTSCKLNKVPKSLINFPECVEIMEKLDVSNKMLLSDDTEGRRIKRVPPLKCQLHFSIHGSENMSYSDSGAKSKSIELQSVAPEKIDPSVDIFNEWDKRGSKVCGGIKNISVSVAEDIGSRIEANPAQITLGRAWYEPINATKENLEMVVGLLNLAIIQDLNFSKSQSLSCQLKIYSQKGPLQCYVLEKDILNKVATNVYGCKY